MVLPIFWVYACMSSVTGCVLCVMHFMLPLGTQGRLLSWFPDKLPHKKAISASCPELTARFMKEGALEKKQDSVLLLALGHGREGNAEVSLHN